MRELGAFGRQGLVVELLGRLGIERGIELVAPAEFTPLAVDVEALAASAFAGGVRVFADGVKSAEFDDTEFDPAEDDPEAEKEEVAPVPLAPEDAFD